jgi:GT2 family glycosyltransferase
VQEGNRGFAAACNEGARAANGKFLLFVNPDACLDRGSVESLMTVLESHPRIGVVGGRLRFPDGTFQHSCRRFPTVSNILFSRGSILSGIFGGSAYTLGDFEEPTEVPAMGANVMMIRRDLFLRMRGFDERYFMYMEDTDLCRRLFRRGFRNVFVPAAGAVHLWAGGSDAGRIRRAYLHHTAVWKYFMKHLPNLFSVVILPIFLLIHLLLVMAFGRPLPKPEALTAEANKSRGQN